MTRVSEKVTSLLRFRRPVLRMQLTLLYSGLFIGLLAAVLLAAGVLFRRSEMPAAPGVAAAQNGAMRHFDSGPALVALVAVAIALVLAWWLAGRFLRPLRAMTDAAQEISATNLHRRLSVGGPDDELTELGRTLDDLFARLEASFESQRRFVANASHELRTPLAGQRTLLQVALADPEADAKSLRLTCEGALRLGAQQERLIDGLLTLATGERGVERREALDLAEVAESTILARREEAEARGVHIEAALAQAATTGDRSLVESLIANLLDNSMRHNTAGGRVEIATAMKGSAATISVSNTGALIPDEEIDRLFEPFQRLGAERVRPNGGHGLGLAIVGAIALAHGAALNARARPGGGLDIEVSFPPPVSLQNAV